MLRAALSAVTVLLLTVSQAPFAPKVTPLDSPAAPNSSEPRMSVSSKGVLLSWIESNGANASLKFSERTATGWTTPKVVGSGDDWFVNWADVPSVVRLPDGTLIAHWLQKNKASVSAYDVRLSKSNDDGKTWSAPATPHHDNAVAEHGFASMFPMPGGAAGIVWLDGRAQAGHAGHEAGAHAGGAMALRFGVIDHAGKQTQETEIDARVCDCCPTAAAMTADGPIVAFRDRSDKEIRDISVSRFVDGRWSAPTSVHSDNWNIMGCPVNGPALAASGRSVAVAWFTGVDKQNRAFVAFSKDAGKTFGPPIRLDDKGTLGRVDLAMLADGSVIGSWVDSGVTPAELRLRKLSASGERSAAVTVAPIGSDRSAGVPRLAPSGNELVVAWTENKPAAAGGSATLRVRTAVAR